MALIELIFMVGIHFFDYLGSDISNLLRINLYVNLFIGLGIGLVALSGFSMELLDFQKRDINEEKRNWGGNKKW